MAWQQQLNQIKGVLIDVDGTLVTSKKKISGQTRHAVRQLEASDFKVGMATGRSLAEVANYVLPVFHDRSLHIVDNGASIINGSGHYFYRKNVPSALVQQVGRLALSMGAKISFSQNQTRYYDVKFYQEIKDKDKWQKRMGKIDELKDWTTTNLVIYDVSSQLEKKLNNFQTQLEEFCLESWSTYLGTAFCFKAKNINKGTAAQVWAKHHRLSVNNIVIFGDSANDLSIMRKAGLSVAMGNAEPAVKKAADVTIKTSDKNGISRFVHKYLL